MLIDIAKIKVTDRIRKEFGNIDELAQDIELNGLINPPVVTPDYELIAGERRLQACKKLGYQQLEVRVMSVKDYEHQLRLEISENEKRKNFTFSEGLEWAKRLEQIEVLKAQERMKNPTQNFAQGSSKGESAEIVAKQTGFGNKETYRQAKFIAEHADEETIRKLNEEKISIHRAYMETKKRMEEAENAKTVAENRAKHLEQELANERNKPAQVIEKEVIKEVVPDKIQKKLKDDEVNLNIVKAAYREAKERIAELERKINDPSTDTELLEKKAKKLELEKHISIFELQLKIKKFLEDASPSLFLQGAIAKSNGLFRKDLLDSIESLERFSYSLRQYLNADITEIFDAEYKEVM
ncbi:ParB N-terminal domain-containing protein [Fodinisporobacter ferrooxydans]|uniref:ParB N-terminal domain-containing protein n=1 Tax=Fodinisporobacter ferrooxydans TaxID=2901836 RepID=A0ABY4CSC0_9BACL|nr:ParB N-terminal domain-containing protein [Alicyclobacillaceae bacterium MYW30-H2]